MKFRAAVVALALFAVAACGENTAPKVAVALRVLSPSRISDTIQATFTDPVTVQVMDAQGHGVAGGVAFFIVSPPESLSQYPIVYFGGSAQTPDANQYQAYADQQGMVRVFLRNGAKAGAFRVEIRVGAAADSVVVTIRPGAPVVVTLAPKDTAVYVAASYELTPHLYDRVGNLTPDPVSFTARRATVASSDSNLVQAHATGRAYIVATSGAARDSAAVSVVPQGRILAFTDRIGSGEIAKFVLFDLDGSNYRVVDTTSFAFNNRGQYFFPDGQSVVFHDVCRPGVLCLFTMTILGVRDTLVTPTDTILQATTPQPSRDGAWVYFTAVTGYEQEEIWRVSGTGTGATRISPVSTINEGWASPSPSPDGSQLAVLFASQTGAGLGVMTVATGQIQPIDPSARAALRWSPVAGEIAYFGGGGLRVMRSDGLLVLGPIATPVDVGWDGSDGQIDWSGDGKWLIACITGAFSGARHLTLIDRLTGELLPLAFTARDNLCGATWQP